MEPDIRWITAGYGAPKYDDNGHTHIAVPGNAHATLNRMVRSILGTSGLVALYVPEGVADVYQVGGLRGRVIAALSLLPMPKGRTVGDYYYDDWDKTRRWPIGWPCKVAYSPSESQAPSLREHVETLYGPGNFGPYVKRFTKGPFELESTMQERLNRDFAQFHYLLST